MPFPFTLIIRPLKIVVLKWKYWIQSNRVNGHLGENKHGLAPFILKKDRVEFWKSSSSCVEGDILCVNSIVQGFLGDSWTAMSSGDVNTAHGTELEACVSRLPHLLYLLDFVRWKVTQVLGYGRSNSGYAGTVDLAWTVSLWCLVCDCWPFNSQSIEPIKQYREIHRKIWFPNL